MIRVWILVVWYHTVKFTGPGMSPRILGDDWLLLNSSWFSDTQKQRAGVNMRPGILRKVAVFLVKLLPLGKAKTTNQVEISFLAKPLTAPFPVPLYLVILSQVEHWGGEARQVRLFSAWLAALLCLAGGNGTLTLVAAPGVLVVAWIFSLSPFPEIGAVQEIFKWDTQPSLQNLWYVKGSTSGSAFPAEGGQATVGADESPSSRAGQREPVWRSEQLTSWYRLQQVATKSLQTSQLLRLVSDDSKHVDRYLGKVTCHGAVGGARREVIGTLSVKAVSSRYRTEAAQETRCAWFQKDSDQKILRSCFIKSFSPERIITDFENINLNLLMALKNQRSFFPDEQFQCWLVPFHVNPQFLV